MNSRGFILQPTYRLEAGRAIVHLHGRLESGDSFLVRDSRQTPHFFVRSSDREAARKLGAGPLSDSGKRNLLGEPVLRVEVDVPRDAGEDALDGG